MTWQLHAACRDADPALFFPDGHDAALVVRQTVERFCRRCPVILPCRDAGRVEHGVWGGQVGGGAARVERQAREYQRKRRQRVTEQPCYGSEDGCNSGPTYENGQGAALTAPGPVNTYEEGADPMKATPEPAYDAIHEATLRRELAVRMRRYADAGLDPELAEQAAGELEAIATRLEGEVAS